MTEDDINLDARTGFEIDLLPEGSYTGTLVEFSPDRVSRRGALYMTAKVMIGATPIWVTVMGSPSFLAITRTLFPKDGIRVNVRIEHRKYGDVKYMSARILP